MFHDGPRAKEGLGTRLEQTWRDRWVQTVKEFERYPIENSENQVFVFKKCFKRKVMLLAGWKV